MDTTTFVKQISNSPGYRGQVVHVEHLPSRKARYGALDHPLPRVLQSALHSIGAGKLYTHQAQAIIRVAVKFILEKGLISLPLSEPSE